MKGHWITYSATEVAWLEANRLLPIAGYHEAFSREFGRVDVSAANLHALRKRKGWKTGRTGQFVKGQEPVNKGKPCPPGKSGRHPNARKTQFRKGNTEAAEPEVRPSIIAVAKLKHTAKEANRKATR